MRLTELFDPAAFKLAALTSSAVSAAGSIAAANTPIEILGVPLAVFLAGFAGALVSLSFLPPPPEDQDRKKTTIAMAGHVFCGTMLAAFGQPIAIFAINHFLKPDVAPASVGLGIAGLLGALVMVALPIGIKWAKTKFGGAT